MKTAKITRLTVVFSVACLAVNLAYAKDYGVEAANKASEVNKTLQSAESANDAKAVDLMMPGFSSNPVTVTSSAPKQLPPPGFNAPTEANSRKTMVSNPPNQGMPSGFNAATSAKQAADVKDTMVRMRQVRKELVMKNGTPEEIKEINDEMKKVKEESEKQKKEKTKKKKKRG